MLVHARASERRRTRATPVVAKPRVARAQPLGIVHRPLAHATAADASWPTEAIARSYVITIRPERMVAFRERVGPWFGSFVVYDGVVGRDVVVADFVREGKLEDARMLRDGNPDDRMRCGEIGCYESHVGVWRDLVASGASEAFVAEDDLVVGDRRLFAARLRTILRELRSARVAWDVLYVVRNPFGRDGRAVTRSTLTPGGIQTFQAYLIGAEGARKLLARAYPIRNAIDVLTVTMQREGTLACVAARTSLGPVLRLTSDTLDFPSL